MSMKISDLQVGDRFLVSGFESSNRAYRQKLIAMGIIKGKLCKLNRVAPAGDPVEILVDDLFSVTLRVAESDEILIKKV